MKPRRWEQAGFEMRLAESKPDLLPLAAFFNTLLIFAKAVKTGFENFGGKNKNEFQFQA